MQGDRKHILIIEDNNAMLQLYGQVLTSAGFKVTTAADGQTGWMKAQEEEPDLILLDMIIPKISGSDLLQRLQKDSTTAKIPVVVFSSLNNVEGIKQAMDAGASEYLSKTTSSPKDVVSRVQSVLDKDRSTARQSPQVCPHCHKAI